MWLHNSLVVEQTNGIKYPLKSFSGQSIPSMYEWWTGLEWNGGLCFEKVNNDKQEQLQLSWGKLSCNICMYLYIASILLV